MAKMTARERIKAKIAAGEYTKGGGDFGGPKKEDFIKLHDGKNVVRIFPPADLDPEYSMFYIERLRHFGVGPNNRPTGCPKQHAPSEQCDACDHAAMLKEQAEDAGGEREANMKKAKGHYFCNGMVIDAEKRKLDPSKGCILDAGKMIMGGIVGFYEDDEWGDPWGENLGRAGTAYDLIITKTGKDLLTNYTVQPTKKYANLANTDEMLGNLKNLDELFPLVTSAEMHAIFMGEENEDGSVDKETAPRPVAKVAPKPAAKPAPARRAPPPPPAEEADSDADDEVAPVDADDLDVPLDDEEVPTEELASDDAPEAEEDPEVEVDEEPEPAPAPVRKAPLAPAKKPAPPAPAAKPAAPAKPQAPPYRAPGTGGANAAALDAKMQAILKARKAQGK